MLNTIDIIIHTVYMCILKFMYSDVGTLSIIITIIYQYRQASFFVLLAIALDRSAWSLSILASIVAVGSIFIE